MTVHSIDDVPAVEFAAVSKRFGHVQALDRVSFELEGGRMVALLGRNGAGKTTAVELMLALRRPTSGAVRILGRSPATAVAAGRVGAMLQRGGLTAGAKVSEIIELARRLYGGKRALSDILALAGLSELADRRVERLSGGQAQRVRFAVALAGHPELLFLDEPTVALDVEARAEFWRAVRAVADGGTSVVFATHYLEEADANADRILVLDDGKLVADGTPQRIKARTRRNIVHATLREIVPQRLWSSLRSWM
jgi:ABC-2 type transport system ATP-binding protein